MVGETLSHYSVLEHLGSGGMGDVYRAEDLQLRRIVALKMLRSGRGPEDTSSRLLAEARAASTLNHPNIAVVYEASEVERGTERLGYIAMEFVEGTTVAALLGNGPLGIERTLDITEQMADALQEAHAQGIVHRDLKPSNVMVTAGGRVKVLDFGVAQRRASHSLPPSDETRTSELRDGLTGFVGTLPYAAPEQATGREVDGRADIFSLGVMLYELLNGAPPFSGRNAAQMLEAILRDEVPPFRRTDDDPRLGAARTTGATNAGPRPGSTSGQHHRRPRRTRRHPIGRGRRRRRRGSDRSQHPRRGLRQHLGQSGRRLAWHRGQRNADG